MIYLCQRFTLFIQSRCKYSKHYQRVICSIGLIISIVSDRNNYVRELFRNNIVQRGSVVNWPLRDIADGKNIQIIIYTLVAAIILYRTLDGQHNKIVYYYSLSVRKTFDSRVLFLFNWLDFVGKPNWCNTSSLSSINGKEGNENIHFSPRCYCE